ncbi:MAG: OmpA family protein [Lentisphaeraceae bacterium]|nr:OmpA family protein [Lentisphaeraceae bacterium]
MGKKKDEGGAPAYMGLFTSLMTVMLAFFILLVAMADSQDAGFYKGIGSVRNALGITGGYGLMNFAKYAGEQGMLATEDGDAGEALGENEQQTLMSVEGDRGVGTVDIEDVTEVDNGHYISVFIPHLFDRGSAVIKRSSSLADYLRKMSIGFLNVKDAITIRTFSNDADNFENSQILATKRANAIMKFMKNNGLGYERLNAVGYANELYFDFTEVQSQIRQHGQANYFFIYRKTTK